MSAPSNNEFRIAGALGLVTPFSPATQESIVQGIGFPMRPISNVPETTQPNLTAVVAIGDPIQWMGQGYEAGKYYPRGAMITDGEWLVIANKTTLEYAYPAPDGSPTFGVEPFTPATQSDISVINSGNVFTVTTGGWVRQIRVWVPVVTADYSFKVVVVITPPGGSPVNVNILNLNLTAGQWNVIAALNKIIRSGTVVSVALEIVNSDTDAEVTGGWTYDGPNQLGGPPVQSWNRNNALDIVRVSKIDLNSVDRSADLLTILPNSILKFTDDANVGAFYSFVTTGAPVDGGDFYLFPVALTGQGGDGPSFPAPSTFLATVPVTQAAFYSEEVGSPAAPSWATRTGFLQFDGVDQGGVTANSYGVDVQLENGVFPEDWDIVSFTSLA